MKKYIYLPLLALVAGGIGFGLRQWQRVSAFDTQTYLLTEGHQSTTALMVLTGVLVVLFALACCVGKKKSHREDIFYCPNSIYITWMVTSMLLFLAATALAGLAVMDLAILWKVYPEYNAFPVTLLLTTALMIPTIPSVLMVGRNHYRGTVGENQPILTMVPSFSALVWLLFVYQEHTRDPVVARYIWILFAAGTTTIALYLMSAHRYETPKTKSCIFFCLMGIYFGVMSLDVGQPLYATAIALAFVFLLLGNAMVLLGTYYSPYLKPDAPTIESINIDVEINNQEGI